MNRIIEKILINLITEPVFDKFKIRKSDESLIYKTKEGFEQVDFHWHYQTYDLINKRVAMQVKPVMKIRFDILSKWFEEFCFYDLKTHRSNGQAVEGVDGFGDTQFLFYYEGDCFEEHYKKIRDYIVPTAKNFFEKHSSLEKFYQTDVVPMLRGEKKMPGMGTSSDWIFQYAKLTWIIDRPNYYNLKKMLLENIEQRRYSYIVPDPNIEPYYDKIDKIFAAIENS